MGGRPGAGPLCVRLPRYRHDDPRGSHGTGRATPQLRGRDSSVGLGHRADGAGLMDDTERRLFSGLLGALAERFTPAGHVMQLVDWEHRGNCPPGECCLRCQTYAALMIEASELLEAAMKAPKP